MARRRRSISICGCSVPSGWRRRSRSSGDVRLTIITDTSGAVTRAELVSSSGDEMLDGLFGAVAAQLKVDSLRATKKSLATRRVRVGYSCAPNAAVATLEVLRS